MTTSHADKAINQHIGARIRTRRVLMGMSQQKMAEAIGLTFQQVQKYESGANSVAAPRLLQIAQVLDVPVSFLFDGIEQASAVESPVSLADAKTAAQIGSLSPTLRHALVVLTTALASATP